MVDAMQPMAAASTWKQTIQTKSSGSQKQKGKKMKDNIEIELFYKDGSSRKIYDCIVFKNNKLRPIKAIVKGVKENSKEFHCIRLAMDPYCKTNIILL